MFGNDNKSCGVIDKNFIKIVQLWLTTLPDYKEDKELFVKLLDGDFDINYKIPSGSTSFETNFMEGYTIFQLLYCDTVMCRVLIDRGADFTVTDRKSSTVLHKYVVSLGYKSYLNYVTTIYNADDKDPYVKLILSAHITSSNAENPKDKNGVSHFHIACMYNRADTAKFFLDNEVSVNETTKEDAKFYPGSTALHFAVTSCAFETVELLLTSGADMFAQDSNGMNPLHILIIERKKMLIKLQRVLRLPLTDKTKSDISKLQECSNINLQIIHLFLEKMTELSYNFDNTGLSCLHVLCFLGNTSKIRELLDNNEETLKQSVSKDSAIWSGYTVLHFAAHLNTETVELLVNKGADLGAKDAKGVTPFDICLREFSIAEIYRIFLLYPNYTSIVFSDGKTKLCDFIHAMKDLPTFESFLRNNLSNDPNTFVPFDSPICAGFTALHLVIVCAEQPLNWDLTIFDLAYLLSIDMTTGKTGMYLSRIKSCLRYNPDVTSRDARGLTPIHWAFKLQQIEATDLLFKRHVTNSNPVDQNGLSHLHIACAAKNKSVVKMLLCEGAKVNEVVTSSYNWVNSEINALSRHQQVFKYCANKGSTPIHFAATALCPKIIEDLISHGADVLAQDAIGLNPLEKLYKREIFRDSKCQKKLRRSYTFDETEKESVILLVKRIGDRLADTKPKQMLCCYDFLEDELLIELLKEDDASVTKTLESAGITALHVACFTKNLARVNELIDGIDVNARVDLESPLWPGCTPLHLLAMHARREYQLDDVTSKRVILKKLLLSGADLVATNGEGDTPIHLSFQINLIFLLEMVKHLKDFSVNPIGKAGYTHLHIASAYGLVTIVKQLLENDADIDYTADYFVKDFSGFTALHFAAFYHRNDVVDLLLKYKANVNWINGYGGNVLHVANRKNRAGPCLDLLRTLISAGADRNLKDMHGETPREALLKTTNSTKEEIELFLSPHTNFHTFNLMTDEGFLAIALNQRKQIPVYDRAMKSCNVTNLDENGRNIIHNIVSFKRPDFIDPVGEEENEIDETYTPSEDYVLEIRSLVRLGLNIDQQDNKGCTPLHLAARMQNLTGIIGLLENGSDINIMDSDGKPAFAYSFELTINHEDFSFDILRKEITGLDRLIFKTIVTHTYKLNLAGIVISQSTREVVAKMRAIRSYDAIKIENCMNEIEEMKEQQFDSTSITFYDFLSDTGAVSNFPYFLSWQQEVISRTFEDEIEVVREIFPELTGILLWQYRKAMARCNMIDAAMSSLKLLVNFSIPPNILKRILQFCINDELSNLINSITTE